MIIEIHEGQGNVPGPGLVVRDIHKVVAACSWRQWDGPLSGSLGSPIPHKGIYPVPCTSEIWIHSPSLAALAPGQNWSRMSTKLSDVSFEGRRLHRVEQG